MIAYAPVSGRLVSEVTFLDILGHTILWLLIIIVTFGIGLFFYPYSFSKFIINRTYIVTGAQRVKLHCELDIASQIGHILIWMLLSIITLGIAFPFYLYKTWNFALNKTTFA